ncbi:MAG: YCF48-related protein [Gammaproteobacteria bacterium]
MQASPKVKTKKSANIQPANPDFSSVIRRPILALFVAIAMTLFAWLQAPHPDAFRTEPAWISWDYWAYPIERNAFRRLPAIGANLNDIAVSADGAKLWVVGNQGTIVYSQDGGRSWEIARIAWPADMQSSTAIQQNKRDPYQLSIDEQRFPNLYSVYFADEARGWAVGDSGTILITADGGQSWQAQASGTQALLSAVQFQSDGRHGWVVGDGGTILITADGGQRWKAQASGSQFRLNAVQFQADGRHGWAVGDYATILVTADGGQRWEEQNSDSVANLTAVQFLADRKRGWAVGWTGTILITEDGGQRWQVQASGTEFGLDGVQFRADGVNGWAVGERGMILTTADGGRNWQVRDSRTRESLNAVRFQADGRRGWAVGDGGTILATADSGQSWQPQACRKPSSVEAVQFQADGRYGWAVGTEGTILTTADGGQTWRARDSGTHESLNAVHFQADGRRGWIVGDRGIILTTVNSGLGWQAQASSTQAWLSDVQFQADGRYGWAVGAQGSESTVLTSSNGGQSWKVQVNRMHAGLSAVQFLGDSLRGWAVGSGGMILATTDGGQSWQVQTSDTLASLNAVQFQADGFRGWAVGSGGTILATTDGGRSWQPQTSGTQAELIAVQFQSDGLSGWVVGSEGTILTTEDGGESWQPQASGSQAWLFAVQFLADGQRGWVVGNSGTILSTKDGGRTWQDIEYRKYPAPWFYPALFLSLIWLISSAKPVVGMIYAKKDVLPKKFGIDNVGSSDNPGGPTSVDYFGSLQLARDLADFLLNENTSPPLTLAITGDWGSGKSTVMTYLQAQLRRAGMRPVLYNAWHHQEEQQVLGSILECVRQQAMPRWWPWLLPALWFRLRSLWLRGWGIKLSLIVLSMLAVFIAKQDPILLGKLWHEVAIHNGLERPVIFTKWGYGQLCPLPDTSNSEGDSSNLKATAAAKESNALPTKVASSPESKTPSSESKSSSFKVASSSKSNTTAFSDDECRQLRCLVAFPVGYEAKQVNNNGCENLPAFYSDDALLNEAAVRLNGELNDERRKLLAKQLAHPSGNGKSLLPAWLTGLLALLTGTLGVLFLKASSLFGFASTDLFKKAANKAGLIKTAEPVGTRQIWQRRFKSLTELLGNKRLVLFIDDLDRCQREHAMRVLETLNFLVNAGELYVVLGVAPKYVLANVKLHFKELADALHEFDDNGELQVGEPPAEQRKPRNLARFYLQKLINIEVPVPTANSDGMRNLLFGQGGEVDKHAVREANWRRIGHYMALALNVVVLLGVMFWVSTFKWLGSTKGEIQTPQFDVVQASDKSLPGEQSVTPSSDAQSKVAENGLFKNRGNSGFFRPAPEINPTPTQLLQGGGIVLAGLVLFGGVWWVFPGNPALRRKWVGLGDVILFSLSREFLGPKPKSDSQEFAEALEIWRPLIEKDRFGDMHAPRTVKAFLNRLRCLAARWPKDSPEAQLVALSALHFYLGESYRDALLLSGKGLSSKAMTCYSRHLQKFRELSSNDCKLFAYFIDNLEIHKPQ